MFLESCLYGDVFGPVSSNGWSCTDVVTNSPKDCHLVQVECCHSCASYLKTTSVAQLKNTTNDRGSSLDSSILSDPLEHTTGVVFPPLSDQASQSDSSNIPHPIISSEQYQPTISGIPIPSQTIYEYRSSSYVLPLQSSYMPIGHQVPSLSDHVQTYTTFDHATFPNSVVSSQSSKHTIPGSSYIPATSTRYSVNSLPVLLSSDTIQSTNNTMIQSTDIIMPTQTIHVQPSFSITNNISFPSTKIQKTALTATTTQLTTTTSKIDVINVGKCILP